MKLYGLLLTLITGLFFLLGGFLSLKIKDKEKLHHFSMSLAFVIIIGLLVLDLIPECLELLEDYKTIYQILLGFVFVFLGIFLLKILDHFIPDHHHEHKKTKDNHKEHIGHINHIGLLTLISVVLHNLLEGFAIMGMANNDFKTGLLACLSVALHNIPLGATIFSSIDLKENKGYVLLLTLSSLLGGLICLLIGSVHNIILAIVTLITIGMLIYIAMFELFGEIKQNIKSRYSLLGLVCGIIVLIVSLFL